MKFQKQTLAKVALGLVLVIVAGLVSVAISDLLAARQPENSLPTLKVYYTQEEALPAQHVMWESYSWRFFTTVKNGIAPDPNAVEKLEPAWVPPGSSLQLSFSQAPQEVQVSMAKNGAGFIELGGELSVPKETGEYTFRVIGNWGVRGSVVYFFKIQVRA